MVYKLIGCNKDKECLIYASATTSRLVQVIEEAYCTYDYVWLICQGKRIKYFQEKYPKLKCIPINSNYIEFRELYKNDVCPHKINGDVWIPSSFENNMDMFGEVIASAMTVKCRKIIWKGLNESFEVNISFVDKVESFVLWMIYVGICLKTKVFLKMKGYKW